MAISREQAGGFRAACAARMIAAALRALPCRQRTLPAHGRGGGVGLVSRLLLLLRKKVPPLLTILPGSVKIDGTRSYFAKCPKFSETTLFRYNYHLAK